MTNNFTKACNKLLDRIICLKEDLGKSEKTSGNAYKISLYYKRCKVQRQISFVYHDNYKNESSKKDFLYALISDAEAYEMAENYGDFAYSYGYKLGPESRKVYNGCKKQYKLLHWMFNEEEIRLLSMIVE